MFTIKCMTGQVFDKSCEIVVITLLMLDYRLETINFTFKMINYSLVMMVLVVENC